LRYFNKTITFVFFLKQDEINLKSFPPKWKVNMARILTGIQSTGTPHLGNLLGAIIPAIEMSKFQKQYFIDKVIFLK